MTREFAQTDGISTASMVIGVGNLYRSDDGVGMVVARRLRDLRPDITVLECSGEGTELMEAWKNAAQVVLVDALQPGSRPGRIVRFDASTERVPSDFFHYSTHAFSVAEAVEMARALEALPPRLIIYGVEGKSFAAGDVLSPEVAAVIDPLVRRISREFPDKSRRSLLFRKEAHHA